jgi:hypothetical protein
MRLAVWVAFVALAVPASGQDFWKHWGDGKAEVNGYRLSQPRYGEKRTGTAVLIYVTEDFSDRLRVKADPGRHPEEDTYPVLKLNAVRDFPTGIYDYNVMTSTFVRVGRGWPVAKVSFSSQEWCGHVWHQLVPRDDAIDGVFHSYFDGEADGEDTLDRPEDGLLEDALPIVLRGLREPFLAAGESQTVPLLPSLFHSRLQHEPLAWSSATISRAAEPGRVTVPAGSFEVTVYTVEVADGRTLSFAIESAAPHRLVRQTGPGGEELALTGSKRLPYWQLNRNGGERYLKDIGLGDD